MTELAQKIFAGQMFRLMEVDCCHMMKFTQISTSALGNGRQNY